jgi:hypothetical protein
VRRILKPGGCFAAWTYGVPVLVHDGHPAQGVLLAFYGGLLGPYWAPQRALVEAGYRGIEPLQGADFGSVQRLTLQDAKQPSIDNFVGALLLASHALFAMAGGGGGLPFIARSPCGLTRTHAPTAVRTRHPCSRWATCAAGLPTPRTGSSTPTHRTPWTRSSRTSCTRLAQRCATVCRWQLVVLPRQCSWTDAGGGATCACSLSVWALCRAPHPTLLLLCCLAQDGSTHLTVITPLTLLLATEPVPVAEGPA